MRGQRVPVDDAVERVVFRLHRDPVLEGADQVTEVKFSGRAHPRQHTLFGHGIPRRNLTARYPTSDPAKYSSAPVNIKAYRIRKPYGRSLFDHPDAGLRQHTKQHVAAIERRHRDHVEDRQQHVEIGKRRGTCRAACSMTRAADNVSRCRGRQASATDHGADHRHHEVAGRAGGGNQREVALGMLQVPRIDRHGLGPANQRHIRSASRSAETAAFRWDRRERPD